MPIYEFACQTCDTTFETLVQSGESPECPECYSDQLEKLLSTPAKPKTSNSNCSSDLPPCNPNCCRL